LGRLSMNEPCILKKLIVLSPLFFFSHAAFAIDLFLLLREYE